MDDSDNLCHFFPSRRDSSIKIFERNYRHNLTEVTFCVIRRNEMRFLLTAANSIYTFARPNSVKKGSREAIKTDPKMLLFARGDPGYFGPHRSKGVSRAAAACSKDNDSFSRRLSTMTRRRIGKREKVKLRDVYILRMST